MSAESEALGRARQLQASGRPDEATAVLRDIVMQHPDHLEALLLLGAIAGQAGRLGEAADCFRRATELDPQRAESWTGLGLVHRRENRLAESLAAYERALALAPDDAQAHVNLAVALKAGGDVARAITHLGRAIVLAPRLKEAYVNLGHCRFAQGDLDQAGAAYYEALKLDPREAAAALGVAKVLRAQKRLELAEKTLRRAAELLPGDAEILAALGALLQEDKRPREAQAALDAALALDPGNVTALYNLGNLHRAEGRWAEAETCYRRALERDPNDASTLVNLAATLEFAGRPADGLAILERARAVHPDRPEVRYSHGLALLAAGRLREGWLDYACRGQVMPNASRRFRHLPMLDALELTGRKVIVWGDQGLGDEIIYGSFLQDLRRFAEHVVVELDARLVPLFARSFPEHSFVTRRFVPDLPATVSDEEAARVWAAAPLAPRLRGATHQIALPDLGRWLRPDLASFPRHDGYLRADPARIAQWRERLAVRRGERLIGLSWRSSNRDIGGFKSIALDTIAGALAGEGMRLISLQYGEVADEIAAAAREGAPRVEIAPDLDCFNDLDGLAALAAACDGVVTTSSSTAHLAGALGAPTALLCPAAQGKLWYWFGGRSDSPWYPSMRVFRQAPDGSWAAALAGCRGWLEQAATTRR